MANVHPTAVVDPSAQLAEDVIVGPNCIIEGPVRIGAGCRLVAQVFLQGPLVMGEQNTLYPMVCLGYPPQHRRFDPDSGTPGVVIGHRNVFREGATVHGGFEHQPTTLGDDNYLMVNSHVGHDAVIGNHCTLTNGSLVGGHVEMADHVVLGGNSGVHQFVRVGRMAMLSGAAGITQDLPPFCVSYNTRRISSLNLVGLRRAGLRPHIGPLKQAFDILFRQGHSKPVALKRIDSQLGDDPLCRELADFIRTSKRGITGYASSRDSRGDDEL